MIRLFASLLKRDDALSKAHFLLTQAANVTNDYFNLGQGELV